MITMKSSTSELAWHWRRGKQHCGRQLSRNSLLHHQVQTSFIISASFLRCTKWEMDWSRKSVKKQKLALFANADSSHIAGTQVEVLSTGIHPMGRWLWSLIKIGSANYLVASSLIQLSLSTRKSLDERIDPGGVYERNTEACQAWPPK